MHESDTLCITFQQYPSPFKPIYEHTYVQYVCTYILYAYVPSYVYIRMYV